MADIGDITKEDDALWYQNQKIDVLYKRAVALDLDGIEADAPAAEKSAPYALREVAGAEKPGTLILNDMFSRLIGNKQLFAHMCKKRDGEESKEKDEEKSKEKDSLPDLLKNALPATWNLFEHLTTKRDYIKDHPEEYIIKKSDAYGGSGIVLTDDLNHWRLELQRIEKEKDEGGGKRYIIQERMTGGRAYIPDTSGRLDYVPFIVGAYLVDGKCLALEAKFSGDPIINLNQGASRAAVVRLKTC